MKLQRILYFLSHLPVDIIPKSEESSLFIKNNLKSPYISLYKQESREHTHRGKQQCAQVCRQRTGKMATKRIGTIGVETADLG